MLCKKCKKEIPDESIFCNYCGKKQVSVPKTRCRQRARGTGSIVKDKRNPNKPYVVKAPGTSHGVGRYYIGSYATGQEAQAALDEYFKRVRPQMQSFTLDKIYDKWSTEHYKTLTHNGELGYRGAYNYLKPLYARRMSELKTADYQYCIDECAKKYSRAQCDKVKQLCSQLCKYACQNDIITKNYAEYIKLPKEKPKAEKVIFTEDDIKVLEQHTDDERIQIILFLIYTGFRIGEACSLKRDDVNIADKYITGGNKTDAGRNRVVPIEDADIWSYILGWYAKSEGKRLLLNRDVNNFRKREFYPALSDVGLIPPPDVNEEKDENGKIIKKAVKYDSKYTPHSTRHTFASRSESAGVDQKALQKLIGHSKFQTTADIYIHKDIDDLRAEMKKITFPKVTESDSKVTV